VKVPTIDGAVMLSVPAGAQSGTTMRIKGRGFAKKGGERGDQLVTLHIRLPADTAALATLVEALPDEPGIRSDLGV
uniref:DnaJ C-terminal domain-containing protein n=1 Tax=uncultured Sphingorhabdus sp. TaxID=1686106 RepID=UPI00260D8543